MTDPAARRLKRRVATVRNPVVVTRRLVLTLPDRRRAAELVEMFQDPEIARWTLHIPYPYRLEHAVGFYGLASKAHRQGTWLPLQVLRRKDRRLVGGVGLHNLDAASSRAEVGYYLGRPFRGEGYAREAVDAVAKFAFRKLGLHRIEARVFVGNAASTWVLRRAGFRQEGRFRESVAKDGKFRDELIYGRLAGDAGSRSGRRPAGRARPSSPAR